MTMDSNSMLAITAAASTVLVGGVALKCMTNHNYAKSETDEYDLWGGKVNLAILKSNFPTEEELKQIDAPMDKCTHGWYTSKHDGVKLHYRKYVPSKKPKAIIAHMHGIQDHSGNAYNVGGRKLGMALMQEFCEKKGYAVYALDMKGHGFSEGTRMYVDDWHRNRDDLTGFSEYVIQQHSDDIPFFLMGHSYGSTLTLLAGHHWQAEGKLPKSFCGLIVLAPAIVADIPPPPVVYLLKDVLAPKYPTWIPFFMPNPVSADRIWRDPYIQEQQKLPTKDKWGVDGTGKQFCLSTGVQLLEAFVAVQKTAIPNLTVPLCSVQGTKDYPVPTDSTKFLEQHVKTPKEDRVIRLVKDAYHDLLADPAAEEVIDILDGFIEERIKKFRK